MIIISVSYLIDDQIYGLTVKATGIITMGIQIPLKLKNPDACLEDSITCPIPANFNETYSSEFDVPTYLPKVKKKIWVD